MKEVILKILRQTSLNDEQKLKQIFKFLTEDITNTYWTNKLVKLDSDELTKLNRMYGSQVTRNMIENLDSYIYKTGKKYKSHYLTIINWCTREWIEKRKDSWICMYWQFHEWDKECDCGNF